MITLEELMNKTYNGGCVPGACNECIAGMNGELDRPWGQGHNHCNFVSPNVRQWIERGIMFTSFRNNRWEVFIDRNILVDDPGGQNER
jgi:hypothetical protein